MMWFRMVFRNTEGSKVEVYNWYHFLAVSLFSGVLYFAYKRIWSYSLLSFLFLVPGFLSKPFDPGFWGINGLLAFVAPFMLRNYYEKKGWVRVPLDWIGDEENEKLSESPSDISNPVSSSVDDLVTLKKLFDEGVINEEVFERKKKEMGFGD